jgi:hypothetical protein
LKKAGNYYIIVIEETDSAKVVGAGTLMVESKFIHEGGKVNKLQALQYYKLTLCVR